MVAVTPTHHADDEPRSARRGHALRVLALAGWGVVLTLQTISTVHNPGFTNIIAEAGFVILFVLVNLQLYVLHWIGHRSWRRITSKLHGSAYVSEKLELPNRNYVLAELRREMPRARNSGSTFVLLQVSMDNLDQVKERRGDDFVARATSALAETLKRLTRGSDFLAHLGDARFCVMLVDCVQEQSHVYLRRVPGTVSVSDGRQMFDIPVVARVHQYDLEAIYATDVLRELEQTAPLRRRETPRANSYAA